MSLCDIMTLTWSIIPHPPWQFLNTNFLPPSFFRPRSAISLAIICPTCRVLTITFSSAGSAEGPSLLPSCFVLHPLARKSKEESIPWLDVLCHIGLISRIIGDASTCSSTPAKRDFSNFLPQTSKIHLSAVQQPGKAFNCWRLNFLFSF